MDPTDVPRAIAAAIAVARELGLQVSDATVVYNSDRIAVRLLPCDVLARVGPPGHADGARFEAEVARLLAETGSPVGVLAPHPGACVYVRDSFVITLWRYYEQVADIAPAEFADALVRLHAALREIDVPAPHIDQRIAGWTEEFGDREKTPGLPDADRELLRTTLGRVRDSLRRWDPGDQLHGEPHPGNVLGTGEGPRFIDLHTCQRGPIEYDVAFLPEDAADLYPGANQDLVHQFRILMWDGLTTMRWNPRDQFPDRDRWRVEGLQLVRAALARG